MDEVCARTEIVFVPTGVVSFRGWPHSSEATARGYRGMRPIEKVLAGPLASSRPNRAGSKSVFISSEHVYLLTLTTIFVCIRTS